MIDLPECTRYFTARYVKGGPHIGVAVFLSAPLVDGEFLDRSPRLQALVRTETTARAVILMGVDTPVEIEGVFLRNLEKTTKANYLYLVEHAAYSTAHAPDNADASPSEAVDFNKFIPI